MLKELIGRRKRFTIWISAVVAVVLIVTAFAGLLPQGTLQAEAAVTQETSGHIADVDTTTEYDRFLGENHSTQNAGRVWTDKSVSTGNVTFSPREGDTESEPVTVENDSDFLVTYSALATSQQITYLPKIPVDVVFVLDFSASMCWGVESREVSQNDGSDSRIKYMVDALNETIHTLAEDNPQNRIGIVYFNRIGHTMLKLTELSETNLNNVPDANHDGIPEYLNMSNFIITKTEPKREGEATIVCNIAGGYNASTDSKTNIQYGLFEGMSMLADNGDTTFTYEGMSYTRIPNVVLMSDGAPTTISLPEDNGGRGTEWNPSNGSWWKELQNNDNDSVGWGDNDQAQSANGFLPMITAEFMKAKISANYGGKDVQNPDQTDASMYTIGFSINQQTPSMVELANLVLNPEDNWNWQSDDQCREIVSSWIEYVGSGEPTVKYVTESSREAHYFRVGHPTGADGGYDFTSEQPTYVDAYYPADDADALADAFKQITDTITESAKAPTKVEGNDPVHGGYITYTDPIGEYMEVKNIKSIIWNSIEFENPQKNTQDNTTTYTFTGSIDSPVYGRHNVSDIQISVTETEGKQTLEVKIPASAIPIRVNEVDIKVGGEIDRNEDNGAYPIRVLYTVGLKDNVLTEDGYINKAVVTENYLEKNSSNGAVYFYSNLYDGNSQGTGTEYEKTVGNATVTFVPASDNPFYFLQEDTPLYNSENINDPATSQQNTYYFQTTYYEGTTTKTIWLERPASLLSGYIIEKDGQLYLKAGAPRLGYLTDFVSDKTGTDGTVANATGTAGTYFYPTFPNNGTPGTDPFTVYLGNNGRLQTKASDTSLAIAKLVRTDQPGVTAPDADFTFNLTMESMKGKTVQAVVSPGTTGDTENRALSFNADTGIAQFTLKDGQTITIPGLPIGETYKVEEVNLPQGFTVTDPAAGSSERMLAEETTSNSVTFTNTYTRDGSITITKRDGTGNLLLGAGFTVYDSTGTQVVKEERSVQLAEVIKLTDIPDNPNYDAATNRFIVGDTAYIVHHTDENGYFYYRTLTDEEIGEYNSGSFRGTVEAVVEFSDLQDGTYIVKETNTPDDYITAPDIKVTLPEVKGELPDQTYHYDVLYTVENHKGLVLPTTGLNGIGFIVAAGAILAAGGGGYFFFRRLVPAGSRRRRHHR